MSKQRQSQKKMMYWWLAGLLLGSLLAAAPLVAFATGRDAASLDSSLEAVGLVRIQAKKAGPDFTLSDPSRKAVRLADLRGKVVLLTFWTTY